MRLKTEIGSLRLTLNGVQGSLLVIGVKVLDLPAHDERQFYLIVQADTLGPDDRALAGQQQTRGGLEEEEGLLRPRVIQLLDVVPDCMTVSLATLRLTLISHASQKPTHQYQALRGSWRLGWSSLTRSCGQCRQSCEGWS